MTEIDQALVALRDNPRDHKVQSGFYDLFLNMTFFVPTVKEMLCLDGESDEQEIEVPMILDTEDSSFLVFFDQQQRLDDWADQDAPCVQLPGHVLAEMTTEDLFWAMNVGTDYAKQFAPDEIAWLKDVVAQCKAEADRE
ncbi:MAG: SseB family protein [Desulfuromonadales bacterium]|nr:SseB family protein [Desulfuromonadales bacterium]